MGHIAEERLLRFLAVPGIFQRVFQKPALLKLLLLFLIHLPEAQDGLLRKEGFVKKHPDVDPVIGIPEDPPEIPSEILHPVLYQPADALQGKAFHEFPVNILFNDLSHHLPQLLIISRLGDPASHIIGALDHLIGLSSAVHPVKGVVGISQHTDGLIGPLDLRVQADIPPGGHDDRGKAGRHHDEKHQGKLLQPA